MALPTIFGLAGLATQAAGGLFNAVEFGEQVRYEQSVLENNTQMVLASRDAQLRDLETRKQIMAGTAQAVASKSGVRIEGSVVEAIADISAKAEVDKLRVNVMSNNQVLLNRFRAKELGRQKTTKMVGAGIDAFIGTSAGLYGAFR